MSRVNLIMARFALTALFATATLSLAASAPSAASLRAYVANFGGNTVTVIDLTSNLALGSIQTGSKPHGVAISHDGRRVYVSNEGDGTLSVIDAGPDTVLTTLAVGKNPHQVAVSPNDSLVLIAMNGEDALVVIDAFSLNVVKRVSVGRTPHIPIVSPDGGSVYVTSEGDMKVSIVSLDSLEIEGSIPLLAFPRVPAFSDDGSRFYQAIRWLNGALIIDVGAGKVIDWITLGGDRFMADGKHAHGLATRPGRGELWITSQADHDVSIVSQATGELVKRIPTGKDPNWVDFTSDGRIAVVSNTADNSASIIDAETYRVVATVPVGSQPKRLAVGQIP